jgi:hypothetical protein
VLAVQRSLRSVPAGGPAPNYWYLMLRDALNIHGAIVLVHLANVLFWFLIAPTGGADPVRTTVAPLALVLTVTMTLRLVLGAREAPGAWGARSSTAAASSALASKAPRAAFVDTAAAHKDARVWDGPAPDADAKARALYPPSMSDASLPGGKGGEHAGRAL